MLRLSVVAAIIVALLVSFFLFETMHFIFGLILAGGLIIVGLYDVIQKRHAVLRNFPIAGHLRYLLEFIRPEMQQYFIFTNLSGRPFNRETRSLVYQRAKGVRDTMPFGSQFDIDKPGYESARHSMAPKKVDKSEGRLMVGGPECKKPYDASRLNISAMSFGALSKNAVLALNKGAKLGHFAHNTGEGGLSPYHLAGGGDLTWQLGTANFGCRKRDGHFDPDLFKDKASHDAVKMIEIKISQGAKPSHGGILPAAKITQEISEIRGAPMGEDCASPPTNPEFSTPLELLDFVARLRELSGGKPVGFKLCIGVESEFLGICKAMLKTNILPDFITIDGAEGGTGAAPVEYTDSLGVPINDALIFVNNALTGIGIRDKLRVISSGKVASGMQMATKVALGADMCNSARGMMFALGCIQSLQCNANTCPTGVTSQNPRLMRGLVVEDKYKRVANFHEHTIASFLDIVGAMGLQHVDDLSPEHIYHRINWAKAQSYAEVYDFVEANALLNAPYPDIFAKQWERASAERF